MIGDNLDSNVPWLKVMSDNVHRLGWNYDVAPQVMSGIPKFCLGSQLNILFLLYCLFPPFVAYVANMFLIHAVAFWGMLLLLKYLLPDADTDQKLAIYGTAICFALLDFWPSGGLSVAGQPLLLYTFLKIRGRNYKPYHLLIIAAFPFYSSLVLVGFFIIIGLLTWAGLDLVRKKKVILRFCFGIALLAAGYAIAEHQLIVQTFFKTDFISHRTESVLIGKSLLASLGEAVKLELFGLSSHADVFQYPVILLAMLAAMFLAWKRLQTEGSRLRFAVLASLILSFLGGFYHWNGLVSMKEKWIVLRTFDFSRFTFLLPVAFYLILFYSILIIRKSIKWPRITIGLILVMQVGFAFKRNASDQTAYAKVQSVLFASKKQSQALSFRQYYSSELFSRIKRKIGLDPSYYKVAGLGIDPGILLFNGFHTIDAYVNNYPLDYKKTFRKIIARELEKNEVIRSLFDDFGSTCYLFSSEIGARNVNKNEDIKVTGLELNHAALRELDCHYIISAVEIVNHESNHLVYWERFEEPNSPWKIFVYKNQTLEPNI